jgi:hypothetical protein
VRTKFLLSLADKQSEEEESEDEQEEEVVAGPLDPNCCVASGPGMSGGTVGENLVITVKARDSNNVLLKTGGAIVKGRLEGGEKATSDV